MLILDASFLQDTSIQISVPFPHSIKKKPKEDSLQSMKDRHSKNGQTYKTEKYSKLLEALSRLHNSNRVTKQYPRKYRHWNLS